jgi:hypothetical protein
VKKKARERERRTGLGLHGEAGKEAALHELVGVVAHDLAIFAGTGLTLISVDDQV